MRVLLIHPPVPESYYNREFYAPSSLMYLGGVLKKNGDEVEILDLRTFEYSGSDDYVKFYGNRAIDGIKSCKPDLIGFTCLFSGHFPDVLQFSRQVKQQFEHIPVVLGGIHPTIYPSEILHNCPSVDLIVLGEGENTIVNLVNELKKAQPQLEGVDGLAFRKDGEIVVRPITHFIDDLDSLPFPAYDLISVKDYYVDTSDWHNPKNLPINTSLPIITSRSCPNRCNFCSMFLVMGPRWRKRSPRNVVDEIEYLHHRYNHHHFSFMDDNMTLKKSHVLGICDEIIKRRLNIQFETPNGLATGTLDKDVLDSMVEAGLVRVSLAIESGSEYIRNKIMKKNVSTEKIYEVIDLAKQYKDLYVKAFFIIGMPEETGETLMDTYNMIKKINVDRVYLSNVVPFPGTALFDQALRDNLFVDIRPEDFYMSEALYITNYDRFFIKPYDLTIEELRQFRREYHKLIEDQKGQKM